MVDGIENIAVRYIGDWRPMAAGVSLKDPNRRVDIIAKHWDVRTDKFEWKRFPDCYWRQRDTAGAWDAGWVGLDPGWRAVWWTYTPSFPTSDPTFS